MRDRTDLRTEMATLENKLVEARAAATRKNEFLSTLGHELRNPLSTLTNACALLKGPGAADHADRVLAAMERQLAVFRRILDDLRDVTRVDTGRLRLDFQLLNLQAAISSAIELHLPAAQARSQKLRWVFPEPKSSFRQIQSGSSRSPGTCSTTRSSTRLRAARSR